MPLQIGDTAAGEVGAAAPRLASLSVERVWHELSRILSTPDPLASVSLMDRLGVLAAVAPEGTDVSALSRLIARGAPVDGLLRMAALLTGDVATFAAAAMLCVVMTLAGSLMPAFDQWRISSSKKAFRGFSAIRTPSCEAKFQWVADSSFSSVL